MCFSAEADLVSGVVLSGVGVDALRHLPHRRYLPLAVLPLLFGVHQLIEAFAWWGLEGRVPPEVGRAAVWAYLAIAFLVLPPLVPTAMLSAEVDPGRRRRLMPLVVLGLAVAAALVPGLIDDRAGAEVACRYIAYDAGVPYAGFLLPFYVAATCGPMLLSGNRQLRGVRGGQPGGGGDALVAAGGRGHLVVVRLGGRSQRDHRPPPARRGATRESHPGRGAGLTRPGRRGRSGELPSRPQPRRRRGVPRRPPGSPPPAPGPAASRPAARSR